VVLSPLLAWVAAGEYGYDLFYFRRMLDAGAVDVLQADATRCAGVTGFMAVGALCQARGLPLSAHTAPSLHAHPCCALAPVRHVEYFFDHARIEPMLFEGALIPEDGRLQPDLTRRPQVKTCRCRTVPDLRAKKERIVPHG
jgi:L-alanine-DL-glutamate epimerase-like enolase superfamily enzyme